MVTNEVMYKGKAGIFSGIERSSNTVSAKIFVILEIFLTMLSIIIYYAVPELEARGNFVFFSVLLLLVSIVELVIVTKKEGVGNWLKWMIGISYIVSAVATTSTMGVGGSVLYILPLLLSVQYCSLLFSVFMSVITIMGSFAPLLLTSFMTFYDLNVIRIHPGSTLTITTTLERSLRPEIIDDAGTKINELLAIFLPASLFVIIIAIVACIITHAFRKNILEQYRHFQNTRE